jgi:hypothetical protein
MAIELPSLASIPVVKRPPGTLGRPAGSPNKITKVARLKAQALLESPEYVASLLTRIVEGTLPPAVETMLWYYAWGKPREVIEVEHVKRDLSSLSDEQLAERADALAQALRERRAEQERTIAVTAEEVR